MRLSTSSIRLALASAVAAAWSTTSHAQVADQFLVYATTSNFKYYIHRYDRRLNLIGATNLKDLPQGLVADNPAVLNGDGVYSVALDPLNTLKLIRIDRDGKVAQVVSLPYNPVAAAIDRLGWVYILTRIPLTIPGPLLAYKPSGSLAWSNWPTTQTGFTFMPQSIAMNSAGQLWIGGGGVPCTPCYSSPFLKQIDLVNGNEVASVFLPPFPGSGSTVANYLVGEGSGAIWALSAGQFFHETQGAQHIQTLPFTAAGYNGDTQQFWIDAAGDIWAVANNNPPYFGTALVHLSGQTGAYLQIIETDIILSMAPGSTGEEVFLTTNDKLIPFQKSLRRINLVTGAQSSVPMFTGWFSLFVPVGDPTGWNWAAVVDRDGDNDGDGANNGAETDAGSNPYDPLSRPEGPKVYLWFLPGSNALALRFKDPNGLIDPVKGLDLATLKVIADGYGDILPWLWSFMSSVTISADGTDATVLFGSLPIPNHLKLRMEVQASDLQGFRAYDWQITPPGVAAAP